MLLNKVNLAAAAFASQDETRWGLSGLRVTPELVIATDGHTLATVTLPTVDEKDFPAIEGMPPVEHHGEPAAAFTIPADEAKRLARMIPKGRTVKNLPILAHVQVADVAGNGHYKAAATDLEAPAVVTGQKIDHEFPRWEAVMPKSSDLQTAVGLDPRYLKRVAELMIAAEITTVKVEMPRKPDCGPARFTGSTPDGQTVTAIVMPKRL